MQNFKSRKNTEEPIARKRNGYGYEPKQEVSPAHTQTLDSHASFPRQD